MQKRGRAGTQDQLPLQNPCTQPPSDFRSQSPKSEVPATPSCGLTGTLSSAECLPHFLPSLMSV